MTDTTTIDHETIMSKKTLIITLVSLIFVACTPKTVFSEFQTMPLSGWHQDSTLHYAFTMSDTVNAYDLIICVRHTEVYPYQNMWLFCSFGTPLDSVTLWHNDTIEFYLADDRGQWLGNKAISYMEMPVLFAQNYRFHREGEYQFTITQAMRETLLRGVSDVGLIVRKSE